MKTAFFMFLVTMLLATCSNASSNKIAESLCSDIPDGKDTIVNFENETIGISPTGFSKSATGVSKEMKWTVVNETQNNVVSQQAINEGSCYNILVLDNAMYVDFIASVRIKAVSGNEDQGGGLVWRYIDNNNYYIARYNPLENNLRFYRVVNGSRKQLLSVDSNIKQGEWFTMSIEMNGNKITCALNGVKLIETTDDTFKSAGQIGFWTKADAVTYFDDLKISIGK
jgi:hypothetical protein